MKPKMFPWSKGKRVWFWQQLSEELRHSHFGSSLHSSGLSSQEQSSPRRGWVTQHAAVCPGTSWVARESGGLPVLLQDIVLPWDSTGFSLSICIIARPSPSHLTSDGAVYFWSDHVHRESYWLWTRIPDVTCVLKSWLTTYSWLLRLWSRLRGYCWEEKGWLPLWMI